MAAFINKRKNLRRPSGFLVFLIMKNFFLKKILFLVFCAVFVCARFQNAFASSASSLSVKAEAAIMVDFETGVVLYEKNPTQKLYPASVTKLMTTLLAIEYADGDYSEIVSFSRRAVDLPNDSSGIGMQEGEQLSFKEAIYAILLPSANEVANAVAEHIAGSIEGFVDLMNERAAELGCVNTHFKNPHGLHDDDHYTCPYDMSLIMRECARHPDFLTFVSCPRYEIPPNASFTRSIDMANTDKMIQKSSEYYNKDIIGGKTGYTDEARHTLVSLAQRGGAKVVCAVMKAAKNEPYTDTAALINYGFAQYFNTNVFDKTSFSVKKPVVVAFSDAGLSEREIEVRAASGLTLYLPAAFDISAIARQVILPERIYAPVYENDVVGHLILIYNGAFLSDIDLVASQSVPLDTSGAPAVLSLPSNAFIETNPDAPELFTPKTNLYLYIAGGVFTAVGLVFFAVAKQRYRHRNIFTLKTKRFK